MPTKIEWANEVWNPVTGCTKVDEGCRNCYAERMSKRLKGRCGYPADDPFRVTLHPDRLDKPLHWRKPRRVFVNSMSDLFHKDVPHEIIGSVWVMMEACPQHQFIILTKRADLMRRVITGYLLSPLPNVWLGVSVHDQASADERLPVLLQTPAAKRFLSIEPCLGAVDFAPRPDTYSWLQNTVVDFTPNGQKITNIPALDLVILGGESGPGARPMHPDWARSVRDQCQAAGVPFMFKQWGEYCPPRQLSPEEFRNWVEAGTLMWDDRPQDVPYKVGKKAAGRLLDGVIHDGE